VPGILPTSTANVLETPTPIARPTIPLPRHGHPSPPSKVGSPGLKLRGTLDKR
jgi:hypothetical protein